MKLQEFINKYKGQKVDFDGFYAGQCVDLFRQYNKEVLGIEQPLGVTGAADFWTNYETDSVLNKNFEKIINTPDFTPKSGDVAVWNKRMGNGFGHIAICTGKGDLNTFESFDQNWSKISYCELVTHTYSSFYGVLRPKVIIMDNSELLTKIENLEKEILHKNEQIGSYVAQLEGKIKEYAELNGRLKELTSQCDSLRAGMGEKEAENTELKAEILRVKKALEEEIASQTDFGDQAAKEEAKRIDLENRVKNNLNALESSLKMQVGIGSIDERFEALVGITASCGEKENLIVDLFGKIEDREMTITKLLKQISKLKTPKVSLKQKIINLFNYIKGVIWRK